MRRKRRNHSPAFKDIVALAAMKDDKTLAQLASDNNIHVNQIQSWHKQLKENISGVFESQAEKRQDYQGEVKELQAKVGQLTMENNFYQKRSIHDTERAQTSYQSKSSATGGQTMQADGDQLRSGLLPAHGDFRRTVKCNAKAG